MKNLHHLEAKNLRFSVFSSKNLKALSVSKIITPLLFDQLGHALPGGLYDSKMGPFAINSDPCATCFKTLQCNGHMGHIELSMLVFNPIFMRIVYDILRITCFSCFRLQISEHEAEILTIQLKLLDAGYVIEAQEIEIFKSEVVATQNNEDKNSKLNEYKSLIESGLPSCDVVENTKNSEALRTSIVSISTKSSPNKRCVHCKEALKKVKYSFKKLMISASKADFDVSVNDSFSRTKTVNKAILADECREYLRKVYESHSDLMKLLFPVLMHAPTDVESAIDIFFMDIIPVPSPLVRPANRLQNQICEHPQTTILKSIVEANMLLKAICSKINDTVSETQTNEVKGLYDSAAGDTQYEKMYNAWQKLQLCVDQTWDSSLGQNMHGVQGLKQVLEKKTGIIRLHMMGKRVNYAARTVITPDPLISVDEIGIPEIFARKLSYPVPVTSWNVAQLRKMITNGPNTHPGANFIENENGHTQIIPPNDQAKRESLAKTLLTPTERGVKIVHRHLVSGDVMLLNRQPTLHKNSIMAHKVRILKGEKTFRLHYSNCKSYNADFDGDEMNAHVPQNELGRSEAYNLVNVSNQYLVPKDGTPLGGLIQDHVISGVKMSIRGRFFNREDYQQLVYVALSHISEEIKFLPPALIKPKRLWSGKQILSTILMNIIPPESHKINLKSSAKTSVKSWQKQEERPWLAGGTPLTDLNSMTESEVVIRGGELVVGVLDKEHFGATTYGLVHCMYELYGGQCSTQLLSSFSKIFTFYLQREGFTLGVRDILVLSDADKDRRKIIKRSRKIGHVAVATALDLPINTPFETLAKEMEEANNRDPKFRALLDRAYKSTLDSFTNRINKVCLPAGLLCKFPENNLQLMVGSGAKGSTVNTMQISCLLGQIELEGKRPPVMISGRTLPSFPIFEMSPKAGGFIDGRFMTGIQPQDFFFHCMAGREGLIDTAVKTSRSGYLQRCLIKHLEGLNVHYDMTVRDSDNSVIQFLYGEDGMDISKSKFLKPKLFPFLSENVNNIIPNDEFLGRLKDCENYDSIIKYKKKLRTWQKKNPLPAAHHETSFQRFSREIKGQIDVKNPEKCSRKSGRRKIDQQIVKLWNEADDEHRSKYSKKCVPCPDPVVSRYQPDCNFGSLSEHMESMMAGYKRSVQLDEAFQNVIAVKSMNSLVAPGEPVGLIAAQSIGEPSTQMTLNTFHFAGRGEMNVTLGIPRLREILMFATENIKTPSLDIPFLQHKDREERADTLRKKMAKVTVADVLENVNVKSNIVLKPTRARNYVVRFNFLPRDAYDQDFAATPKRILRHMHNSFFKTMFKTINKAANEKNSAVDIGSEEKKKKTAENYQDMDLDEREPDNDKSRAANADSSDDEAIGEDDDATAVKLKSNAQDECDYDEAAVDEEKKDASDNESDVEMVDAENGNGENAEDKEKTVLAGFESSEYRTEYRADTKHHLWCELTFQLDMSYKNIDISNVLKEAARKSVISEVPLIKRAITYDKNNDIFLKTDGINITEMFKHRDVLDLNRLYTNQIHAMAQTYGIEAAARVIVKEVQQVFQVYGITVDPRHLLLIADYMTFDGTFKPLSRAGIESCASPLQQMSFESTLKFLKSAIVKSQMDSLNSPSSRLMLGQPCKSGTGAFTCMTNYNYLLKGLIK